MSSDQPLILRGITWNHTRGFTPLVATAQRYSEQVPGIEIRWERRSLKAFEEFPVERLALEYDLLVIDHPFVGYAAQHGPLVALDEWLPREFLEEQNRHSVGASHRSYQYGGHQWALAIDAATPVAVWREDLLQELGIAPPVDWNDVVRLAREGRVELPAAPINCLMNFYAFCVAEGERPFSRRDRVVSPAIGRLALERLRDVLAHCEPGAWERNPIGSHERLAAAGNRQWVYCPLAYGYSNYARRGYAAHWLTFGEPPALNGSPLPTTLGGTGLAVSASRPHVEQAVAFTRYVATSDVQRTLYADAGGQPGHRSAWLDPENNRLTNDTFRRTLPALDRAYLRPRYSGYVEFQERAGPLVHAALRRQLAEDEALRRIDECYRETARHAEGVG